MPKRFRCFVRKVFLYLIISLTLPSLGSCFPVSFAIGSLQESFEEYNSHTREYNIYLNNYDTPWDKSTRQSSYDTIPMNGDLYDYDQIDQWIEVDTEIETTIRANDAKIFAFYKSEFDPKGFEIYLNTWEEGSDQTKKANVTFQLSYILDDDQSPLTAITSSCPMAHET